MIEGMLIKNKEAKQIKFKDSLSEIYKLIDCEYDEMPCRRIKHKMMTVICDEEGLFKSMPVKSAICDDANEIMVGNLLIAGLSDEDGNLTSLTAAEMKAVADAMDRNGILHYSVRS